MCGRASRHDAALRVAAPLWHRCVLSCRRPRRSALTRAQVWCAGGAVAPGRRGGARGVQAVASVEGCECQNNGSPTHATVSEPSAHTLKVAAYEVIQANACTGTGEHSASEARRCLYFLPHFRGQRSFAPAPRRTRAPRSAATAPARGRCCERTRSGYSGGEERGARGAHRSQEARSEPLERASTAGGELALARRRTRGVRRGARRRQAAATGAVRAALLYAAVARPSCRAIGRGAAC